MRTRGPSTECLFFVRVRVRAWCVGMGGGGGGAWVARASHKHTRPCSLKSEDYDTIRAQVGTLCTSTWYYSIRTRVQVPGTIQYAHAHTHAHVTRAIPSQHIHPRLRALASGGILTSFSTISNDCNCINQHTHTHNIYFIRASNSYQQPGVTGSPLTSRI